MPDVDKVISLLSNAIQTCPQAAQLRLLRADAYIKKSESDMAIGDLVRATSLKPDNLDALVKLADIHMSMGEPSECLKHIKQCLHADPENKKCKALFKKTKKLEKTFKRAEDAMIQSDFKQVLEVLNDSLLKEAEAVEGPRMKLRVYEMACKAHAELKDAKQTISFCTKVLKLDENNIDALAARGEMYIQEEDYEAAQRDYSKAHGIDQNNRKIVEGLHRAQKMAKTAARKDYYKILGVSRTANKKEIKKGYRAMATIYRTIPFFD
jgi:DnaJ family protein C protein 3